MIGYRFSLCWIMMLSILLVACQKDSSASINQNKIKPLGENLKRIKHSKVLRVGMEPAELPWAFYAVETNETTGYEVDLAYLLAKELGADLGAEIKVEIVPGDWHQLPDHLRQNKIDVIGNAWTPTEETQDISWTRPYHKWSLVVATRLDSPYQILDDIKDKKVGRYDDPVSKAYFYSLGFQSVSTYANGYAGIDDLLAGKIEAFIYDSAFLLYHAKQTQKFRLIPSSLREEGYHYGVRQSEPDLFNKIDQIVIKMKASPSYKKIMIKWFGDAK